MTRQIRVELAPGELIDKITILEIKAERIADAAKRANVLVELRTLTDARPAATPPAGEIDRPAAAVKPGNGAWRGSRAAGSVGGVPTGGGLGRRVQRRWGGNRGMAWTHEGGAGRGWAEAEVQSRAGQGRGRDPSRSSS